MAGEVLAWEQVMATPYTLSSKKLSLENIFSTHLVVRKWPDLSLPPSLSPSPSLSVAPSRGGSRSGAGDAHTLHSKQFRGGLVFKAQ